MKEKESLLPWTSIPEGSSIHRAMLQSLCVSIIQNALYMRVWTESISPMPFWSLTERGWSVHEGGQGKAGDRLERR